MMQHVPKSRHTCSLKEHPIFVVFIFVGLNFNQKIYQLIKSHVEIAFWGVAASRILNFDVHNYLERAVGTTATSVTF
jgi:hypothetical protein